MLSVWDFLCCCGIKQADIVSFNKNKRPDSDTVTNIYCFYMGYIGFPIPLKNIKLKLLAHIAQPDHEVCMATKTMFSTLHSSSFSCISLHSFNPDSFKVMLIHLQPCSVFGKTSLFSTNIFKSLTNL